MKNATGEPVPTQWALLPTQWALAAGHPEGHRDDEAARPPPACTVPH
ncbi:MAG: hypothetical protein ABSF99_09450 [Anaerolineales bacterium]|jgi:hypothetical protein